MASTVYEREMRVAVPFLCPPLRFNEESPLSDVSAGVRLHYNRWRAVFSTCTNPIIHFSYPPKFCLMIVCNFSWVMEMSQEKSKTMYMPNVWGVKEVYYGIGASRE